MTHLRSGSVRVSSFSCTKNSRRLSLKRLIVTLYFCRHAFVRLSCDNLWSWKSVTKAIAIPQLIPHRRHLHSIMSLCSMNCAGGPQIRVKMGILKPLALGSIHPVHSAVLSSRPAIGRTGAPSVGRFDRYLTFASKERRPTAVVTRENGKNGPLVQLLQVSTGLAASHHNSDDAPLLP